MRLSKFFKAICTTKTPATGNGTKRARTSPTEVARDKRQREATSELAAFMQAKPITEDEQAAWHAGLDEGRRQGRASAEIERGSE